MHNLPPRGASFRISLPVMPVAETREVCVAGSVEASAGGRILLVDDEEAVLELEQEILSGRCHSVKAVRTGREALRILEKESMDLVVADLKMPGEVTGRDLYDWIRQQRPELAGRVVFTMSDARGEDVGALLEESGCPFIQKPFEVGKFLTVIRRALAQSVASVLKR